MHRRDLLKLGAAASFGAAFPGLADAANPPAKPEAPASSIDWKRSVVLVEMRGGNDGLNTVVPFSDPLYYKHRPRIGVPEAEVLKLGKSPVGLNPVLKDLLPGWEAQDLAIALGVGYPRPNRSHFRGIDIWHSASKADELLHDGWLSRILVGSAEGKPADLLADGIVWGYSDTVGYAGFGPLYGHQLRTIIMNTTEDFVRRAKGVEKAPSVADANPSLKRLLAVQDDLDQTADRLIELQKKPAKFKTVFPGGNLAANLKQTVRLLAAGAHVPVFKLTIDGFDTHAGQKERHERLLTQVGGALGAFRAACIESGVWDNVLLMTYSEFGRRVYENDSLGTDHGTAAPHFIMGGKVKGGLYGTQPKLDQLDDGDLVHTTDYRSLYQTVAKDWWGYKPDFLTEKRTPSLGCVKA